MAVAVALILTTSVGQGTHTTIAPHQGAPRNVASVQLTSTQREQLHRYMTVPAHRKEVSSLLERSFEQAGLKTGTDGVQVPGRTSFDLAYGITGEHVWVIVSFNDVYDGAVAAMTSGCVYLLDSHGVGWLSWTCGWMAAVLSNWSAGHAWAANHGVWIAVYWYPWVYYRGGYW